MYVHWNILNNECQGTKMTCKKLKGMELNESSLELLKNSLLFFFKKKKLSN